MSRNLDFGVLPVDKPAGPTSHDIVSDARRALDVRRIGHTGTLDPFASGLLLLCVGKATRLAEYLSVEEKEYEATARLGIATDTLDTEGEIVAESEGWREIDSDDVEAALKTLRGRIEQRPPRFSAKKIGGEPAHRRARRGEEIEPEPVTVEIPELELIGWHPPEARFRVVASAGTYIRAVARDLGEALECGAHLVALRRTRIGPHRVEDAVPAGSLDDRAAVVRRWIPAADALPRMRRVRVSDEAVRALYHGQSVVAGEDVPEEPVLALRGDELVAVCSSERGRLRPRKVFVEG